MISSPDLVVVPARWGVPNSSLSQYAEQLHEATGLSVMSLNPAVPRHNSCSFDWDRWDVDVDAKVTEQIGDGQIGGVVIFNQGDDRHRDGVVLNAIGHMARELNGIIGVRSDEESPHMTFASHGLPKLVPGSRSVYCGSDQFRGPLISLRARNATPLGAFIRQHLVAVKEEQ